MKSGTRPTFRDNRDYDFHARFGAVGPNAILPDDLSVDLGLTMPDQQADQNPFECTDYTTRDIATDQDGTLYAPGYLYSRTLLIAGAPPNTQGADIRTALKASCIYGLLPDDKAPQDLLDSAESYNADWRKWPIELDAEAAKHRRGHYFNVQPINGDWFEGIRSAVFTNRSGVSIGTPWYAEWEKPVNGIMYPGKTQTGWHNWKVAGWKSIGGVPHLLGKTWQGKEYGDNGYVYFSRETINSLWKIYGTQAFVITPFTVGDIPTIQIDILTTIITFLVKLRYKLTGT